MIIIEKIEDISSPFKNAVVAIGNFDGVHLGHQALFHAATEKADAIDGTAVGVTFEPHPIQVLKGLDQLPRITNETQKKELIAKTGIDVLICIPFTFEFATISAQSFITDLLIDKIGMKACLMGADFTFGKNRSGDLNLLKQYAKQYGFGIDQPNVDPK